MRRLYLLPTYHGCSEELKFVMGRAIKWDLLDKIDVFYGEGQPEIPPRMDLENVSMDYIVSNLFKIYRPFLTDEDIRRLAGFANKKIRIVLPETQSMGRRTLCELQRLGLRAIEFSLEFQIGQEIAFKFHEIIARLRDYKNAMFFSKDLKEGENGLYIYGLAHEALPSYLTMVTPPIQVMFLLTPKESSKLLRQYEDQKIKNYLKKEGLL